MLISRMCEFGTKATIMYILPTAIPSKIRTAFRKLGPYLVLFYMKIIQHTLNCYLTQLTLNSTEYLRRE